MRRQPAVFLDRDGVINEDPRDYVKSWQEFSFFPGALEALRRLREARCEIYVVTNQAGVGKGLMSRRALRDILWRLHISVRAHGGLIHGIAFCPHPREAGCLCRKPLPGMLRTLALKYGLDLSRSVFVGDSYFDVQCGQAAGCQTIFVHTRPPESVAEHLAHCEAPPDYQCANLSEAVDIILQMPQFALSSKRRPLQGT